jgi:hypothetical protein
MNKELSEDRKEMVRIMLALVVMAIIFWFMLISASVQESRDPRTAAGEAVCSNSGLPFPWAVYCSPE